MFQVLLEPDEHEYRFWQSFLYAIMAIVYCVVVLNPISITETSDESVNNLTENNPSNSEQSLIQIASQTEVNREIGTLQNSPPSTVCLELSFVSGRIKSLSRLTFQKCTTQSLSL